MPTCSFRFGLGLFNRHFCLKFTGKDKLKYKHVPVEVVEEAVVEVSGKKTREETCLKECAAKLPNEQQSYQTSSKVYRSAVIVQR